MINTGSAGPVSTATSIESMQRRDAPRADSASPQAPVRGEGAAARVSISREATQFSELKSYVRQLLEEQASS
ncbi:MAG: hypothetical protein R3A46_13485 [Thermomicrobiales bacterium]